MRKSRTRCCSIVALLTVAVAAGGCGKKDGGKPKRKVDKQAYVHFAPETEFLLGINGVELRKSQFYDQVKGKIPGDTGLLVRTLSDCGIDVYGSFKAVTVGGQLGAGPNPLVEIVGFYPTDLRMCDGAEGIEIAVEENLTTLTTNNKQQLIAWIADDRFIGGYKWPRPRLVARQSATSGADQNQALMDLLGEVDTSAAVWLAFRPAEGRMAFPIAGDLTSVIATARVANGLELVVELATKDSSTASSSAKTFRSMLPQIRSELGELGKFLDNVELKSSGKKITVKVVMNNAELTEFRDLAKDHPKFEMLRSFLPF